MIIDKTVLNRMPNLTNTYFYEESLFLTIDLIYPLLTLKGCLTFSQRQCLYINFSFFENLLNVLRSPLFFSKFCCSIHWCDRSKLEFTISQTSERHVRFVNESGV